MRLVASYPISAAILRRGPLCWYPSGGGLSALTPMGRSARNYNMGPPRSAKLNGARDNPLLLRVHGRLLFQGRIAAILPL